MAENLVKLQSALHLLDEGLKDKGIKNHSADAAYFESACMVYFRKAKAISESIYDAGQADNPETIRLLLGFDTVSQKMVQHIQAFFESELKLARTEEGLAGCKKWAQYFRVVSGQEPEAMQERIACHEQKIRRYQFFVEAKKSFKLISEGPTNDQKDLTLLQTNVQNLKNIRDDYFNIADDNDEHGGDITDMVRSAEKIENEARDRLTKISTLAQAELFADARQIIIEACEKKKLANDKDKIKVMFYIDGDPNTTVQQEISPEDALIFLDQRCLAISRKKYEQYIAEVIDSMGKEFARPFKVDPRKILSKLQDNITGKHLTPLQDKNLDSQKAQCDLILKKLRPLAKEMDSLDAEVQTCQGGDIFAGYRALLKLKDKIIINYPFYISKYDETQKRLEDNIRGRLDQEILDLKNTFNVDLSLAGRKANKLSNTLIDLDKFNNILEFFKDLASLVFDDLLPELEKIKQLEPGTALEKLEETKKKIIKHGLNVPEWLSENENDLIMISQPTTQGQILAEEITIMLSGSPADVDKLDLDIILDKSSKLEKWLTNNDTLNKNSRQQTLSELFQKLQNLHGMLGAIKGYRLAKLELDKEDSDLSLADQYLKDAENFTWITSQINIQRNRFNQKKKIDVKVQPVLEEVSKLLQEDNTTDEYLKKLILILKKIKQLKDQPTTKKLELQQKISQVEDRLKSDLSQVIQDYIRDKARFQTIREFVDEYERLFGMEESWLQDAQISLLKLEAHAAEDRNEWELAQQIWLKAKQVTHSDGQEALLLEAHRLACQKVNVIVKATQSNYLPLRQALRSGPLKDDPDLIAWDAKQRLELVIKEYSGPPKLIEKTNANKFLDVIAFANLYTGMGAEDDLPLDNENDNAGKNIDLIKVWITMYVNKLTQEQKIDLAIVAYKAQKLMEMYEYLIGISKQIRVNSRFRELQSGYRRAENFLADDEDIKQRYQREWDQYRRKTLQDMGGAG